MWASVWVFCCPLLSAAQWSQMSCLNKEPGMWENNKICLDLMGGSWDHIAPSKSPTAYFSQQSFLQLVSMAAKPSLAKYKLPIETNLIPFMKNGSQMVGDCVEVEGRGSVAADEGKLFWPVWKTCVLWSRVISRESGWCRDNIQMQSRKLRAKVISITGLLESTFIHVALRLL